jgi:hypothetical protein
MPLFPIEWPWPLAVQSFARSFDRQIHSKPQPEAAMPEKISIQIYEKREGPRRDRGPEADQTRTTFDKLEALAKVEGFEARRAGGLEGRKRPEMGGGSLPPSLWQHLPSFEMVMIGIGGAAATAAAVRYVLGIAKDWIELSKNTKRSVKVTIGDKVVEIKEGDDILEIVRQHFPDDGTSNPL